MKTDVKVFDDDLWGRARGLHQRHINMRLRASHLFCM